MHPPALLVKLMVKYGRKKEEEEDEEEEDEEGRKTGRGHQGKYCDLDIRISAEVCFFVFVRTVYCVLFVQEMLRKARRLASVLSPVARDSAVNQICIA